MDSEVSFGVDQDESAFIRSGKWSRFILTKASPVLKSSANHDIYFKKLWLMVEGFQSKINMLLIAIRSVGRCDSFLLYGGASWKRVRHW